MLENFIIAIFLTPCPDGVVVLEPLHVLSGAHYSHEDLGHIKWLHPVVRVDPVLLGSPVVIILEDRLDFSLQ